MKGSIFVKYLYFLNPISLNRFMFNFYNGAVFHLLWSQSNSFLSYSISSYTEDSFTFAACHGNRKDDPDGGGDVDDDDDYDDNDDDGDDDDGKYLSQSLQNP